MADENLDLPIRDPNTVPVTFVSDIAAIGFFNGVTNLTFVVAQFSPPSTAGKIDMDLVVSSRLRMDLYCVQRLYEQLGKILADHGTLKGQPN